MDLCTLQFKLSCAHSFLNSWQTDSITTAHCRNWLGSMNCLIAICAIRNSTMSTALPAIRWAWATWTKHGTLVSTIWLLSTSKSKTKESRTICLIVQIFTKEFSKSPLVNTQLANPLVLGWNLCQCRNSKTYLLIGWTTAPRNSLVKVDKLKVV